MSTLPIVLLVHGMGTHPLDNMTKEFKAGLNEAAKGFNIDDFDIDEHMEIVEFNYSETLDNIRQKLADNADEIRGMTAGIAAPALITRLLDFQANLDEDEFIYTHWLDVVLYGAAYYGEPIRVELANKINNLMKRAAGRDIHIVAHSLGTAVVHDTLEKLYRSDGTVLDGVPELIPGIDNVKCLWTFANVSRLVDLLNGITPDDTVVRSGPTGCTDYFYNIRHELDPFTWFKTFELDIENGRHFENKIVRDANTHSFREYVADPLVARYMLLQMTKLQEPKSNDNFLDYIAAHAESSIQGLFEEIKNETNDIRSGDISSTPELLAAITAFVNKVKELTG